MAGRSDGNGTFTHCGVHAPSGKYMFEPPRRDELLDKERKWDRLCKSMKWDEMRDETFNERMINYLQDKINGYVKRENELLERATKAEKEVERLRKERVTWEYHGTMVNFLEERAIKAENERDEHKKAEDQYETLREFTVSMARNVYRWEESGESGAPEQLWAQAKHVFQNYSK